MYIKVEDIILQIFKEAYLMGFNKIGRTRLVKLLYLVEYEYYKQKRERLTALKWFFHHYGPFAHELTELVNGKLALVEEEERELDSGGIAKLMGFRDPEEFKDKDFIGDIRTEFIIKGVVDAWCDADINKLLNYVYHYTEPMEEAKKGDLLDFSRIRVSITPPPQLPKEKIGKLRKKFEELSKKEPKGKPLYPLPELSLEWKARIEKTLELELEEEKDLSIKKNELRIPVEKLRDAFEEE